jgi:hypothetical protein
MVTDEDIALNITLTGSDEETPAGALIFSLLSQPSGGSLSGTAPSLSYTPDADFNGPDSFIFQVSDGILLSEPTTIDIQVTPVNDLPLAEEQTVVTDEDLAVSLVLTASDRETAAPDLIYTVLQAPANGSLTGTAPNLVYLPNPEFSGADSLTFWVNDGLDDSNVATVELIIANVDDSPVAASQDLNTNEDQPLPVILTASDVDNLPGELTFSLLASPGNGALSGLIPNLTYTPNDNFNGTDGFTFWVNDGNSDSNTAIVTLTVAPVNDPPVADPLTLATAEDTPITFSLTGSDVETPFAVLTYPVLTNPANGVLSGIAPELTYTPNAKFHGPDSFTYQISDGTDLSNLATVTLTVNPVDDPPVATSQSLTTDENQAVSLTLTATDVDTLTELLTYAVVSGPGNGSLSGLAPSLTYTPNPEFAGLDSFTFRVNDGTSDSNLATVEIDVIPESTDLVAHWTFDETSGSTATDASGHNNTGTLLGATTWAPGYRDGAVDVVTKGDGVQVSGSDTLNNLNNITLSLWFFADSEGVGSEMGRFIAKDDSFQLRFDNSDKRLYFNAERWDGAEGKWRITNNGNQTMIGAWHHLLLTYSYDSPTNLPTIYLDGVILTDIDELLAPSGLVVADPGDLFIGNKASGLQPYFDNPGDRRSSRR